jgi:hypothetical protein
VSDFRRIVSPPSDLTGPLGNYLREVARAINDIPQISAFSGTDPNLGTNAGYPGDLLINLTSSVTDRRLYVMAGSQRQKSTTGWVLV